MARHSLLAAISLLPAEQTPPTPLVSSPPHLALLCQGLASLSFLPPLLLCSQPLSTKQLSSKKGASQTPLPPSLLQSESFLIQMCTVSDSASEQARELSRQPASCAFPMAAAPSSKRTRFTPGFLPPRQQQRYPGNRLPLQHNPLFYSLGSTAKAVGEEITAMVSHSLARLRSGGCQGVGWGFLLLCSSGFSFSCLAPSATSISYLLSLT